MHRDNGDTAYLLGDVDSTTNPNGFRASDNLEADFAWTLERPDADLGATIDASSVFHLKTQGSDPKYLRSDTVSGTAMEWADQSGATTEWTFESDNFAQSQQTADTQYSLKSSN
eukprot:SAG31_NODE_88_length_26714_cov_6.972046_22_plen_113_part_01